MRQRFASLSAESRIAIEQPHEAAQRESAPDQEHERERHFGDDERAEQPVMRATRATAAPAAQRILRIDVAAAPRREETARQRASTSAGRNRPLFSAR